MAISHCIPPVSRGMNCPSHQRSPLISLVGDIGRAQGEKDSGEEAPSNATLWLQEEKKIPYCSQLLELLSLAGDSTCAVYVIWFRSLWWDCHAVRLYTLTGPCERPPPSSKQFVIARKHIFLQMCQISNQEPRAPTSPTLECWCINMAGKQITCNLSRAGWGFPAVFKLSGALRRDYPKDKCFPLVARTPLTPTACRQQTHEERRRESRRMSHAARRLAGPAD